MSTISAAVEGLVDEAVAHRLCAGAGVALADVHVKGGKKSLLDKLDGYNRAARFGSWLVLVDLDRDEDCAPPFQSEHLPEPHERMCFRVAVRSVEAWLLADRHRFAAFLGVRRTRIPRDPEALDDPKGFVVDLARGSTKATIRTGLVPRDGSGRRVGVTYSSQLTEFVVGHWRPEEAAATADSLARAINCVRGLAGAGA
jgi:hypothetical protein